MQFAHDSTSILTGYKIVIRSVKVKMNLLHSYSLGVTTSSYSLPLFYLHAYHTEKRAPVRGKHQAIEKEINVHFYLSCNHYTQQVNAFRCTKSSLTPITLTMTTWA